MRYRMRRVRRKHSRPDPILQLQRHEVYLHRQTNPIWTYGPDLRAEGTSATRQGDLDERHDL